MILHDRLLSSELAKDVASIGPDRRCRGASAIVTKLGLEIFMNGENFSILLVRSNNLGGSNNHNSSH